MVGDCTEKRITIDKYKTMGLALETCQGERVILEPTGGVSLKKFNHPEHAVYIFGNAMNHNLKHNGVKVRIPTPQITDMFAFNAAAIVLADRHGHGQ